MGKIVSNKRIIGLLLLVLLVGSLAACKAPGEYLTHKEVIREIEKYTGKEKVTILDIVSENGRIRYVMKTDKREIVFEAISHAAGNSGLYNFASVSSIEYIKAIHDLYREEIIVMRSELYGENSMAVFKDKEELRQIILCVAEMDKIYKQELEYHDRKWLERFPVCTVAISHREADSDTKGDFSYGIKIDGSINPDEIETMICDLYEERTNKKLQ